MQPRGQTQQKPTCASEEGQKRKLSFLLERSVSGMDCAICKGYAMLSGKVERRKESLFDSPSGVGIPPAYASAVPTGKKRSEDRKKKHAHPDEIGVDIERERMV